MKYKTVRVSPSGDGWVVSFIEDGVERVKTKTEPNAMGFYHHRKKDNKKALEALVNCMINAHTEDITRLEKSRAALYKLL